MKRLFLEFVPILIVLAVITAGFSSCEKQSLFAEPADEDILEPDGKAIVSEEDADAEPEGELVVVEPEGDEAEETEGNTEGENAEEPEGEETEEQEVEEPEAEEPKVEEPEVEEAEEISDCNKDVIISAYKYENAPDAPVTILDMKIEGDVLKVKIAASSWCGNKSRVELIDSGKVSYSLATVVPPLHHRTLRFSRINDECMSAVAIEMSFNIKDLQVEGLRQIYLHISGQRIFYEY